MPGDPFKQIAKTSVQTTKQATKSGAKAIIDETLEFVKTGKAQVSGSEKQVNNNQNKENQNSSVQEKGYSTAELAKKNAQARRLMQALEEELAEIRRQRDQELAEQRQKEEQERIQKLEEENQSTPPIAQGKKKRGFFGPSARAQKKQQGIETRMSKD